jgi:hypothetical protein
MRMRAGEVPARRIRIHNNSSVAHETAGVDRPAGVVDGGHRMADRQCGELSALDGKQGGGGGQSAPIRCASMFVKAVSISLGEFAFKVTKRARGGFWPDSAAAAGGRRGSLQGSSGPQPSRARCIALPISPRVSANPAASRR